MMVYCLFEQSGTFKNVLKNKGIKALDVDILNHYNETDITVDLFCEIEKAYNNEPSLFDKIKSDDLIFAFFPCTRFTEKIFINARALNSGIQKWSNEKRLEYSMKFMNEVNEYYSLFCKMCIVAERKHLRMIIENPAPGQHYLKYFFPIKATVVDTNRAENGDYYKKPTQYWFINFPLSPTLNLTGYSKKPQATITKNNLDREGTIKERRSLISPLYASWFIDTYIIDNLQTREKQKEEISYER